MTTATAAAGKRHNLKTGHTTAKGAGERNLFDPLFSQHTSKRGNAVTASQAHEQRSTLFSGGAAPPLTGEDISQADPEQLQQNAESSVADIKNATQSEINASLDPIKALKSLFNKQSTTRRTALDVNHVIHKYKQKQRTKTQGQTSRALGARPYFSQHAGRGTAGDDEVSARFVEPELAVP